MTEQSLRDALEQLADLYEAEGRTADDGVSHHRIVGGLRHLLKAYPAEPVGVSDEAVEAGAKAIADRYGHQPDMYRGDVRAALEAARPLMGATPTPNRHALESLLADELASWTDDAPAARWQVAKALAGPILALMGGAET